MVQNPNLVFFVCNEPNFYPPNSRTMTHHSLPGYLWHADFRQGEWLGLGPLLTPPPKSVNPQHRQGAIEQPPMQRF